jgi:hypothetical protein
MKISSLKLNDVFYLNTMSKENFLIALCKNSLKIKYEKNIK